MRIGLVKKVERFWKEGSRVESWGNVGWRLGPGFRACRSVI